MKAPAFGPKGALGLVVLAVAIWIAWELYKLEKGASNVLGNVSNELAGLFVPDANVALQAQFTDERAELKAAGYPPVGSAAYNRIVSKYNPAQVVNNGGGSGG